MKTVLLISMEFPPKVGGAGVVGLNTAKALSGLGYDVTVVTEAESAEYYKEDNLAFDLISIKTIKFLRPWIIWFKLRRVLTYFDLIILNDGVAKKFGAYCLPKKILCKTVVYSHGQEGPAIFNTKSLKYLLARYPQRLAKLMHRCKKVVAVSNYMKSELLSCHPLANLGENIEVVYNSYDSTVFKPLESDVRERLGIAKGVVVLVSACRIVREKGLLRKLDIFSQLHSAGYYYHWIVIGDGDLLGELNVMVQERGLGKYVHFIGKLPQAKMAEYFSAADVFWLLSELNESLGNVYIEANACLIPTIGFDKGGVKEAIEDGGSGFLVTNNSECISILKNKKWLQIDQGDIIRHVSNFTLLHNLGNAKFLKKI